MDAERENGEELEFNLRTAFRACQNLRKPLAAFTGVDGYRALVSRAVTLARAKAPLLSAVRMGGDGSFHITEGADVRFDGNEAAHAGIYLVAEMLGLLATFVGWPLTLVIVRGAWPDVHGEVPKGRDS